MAMSNNTMNDMSKVLATLMKDSGMTYDELRKFFVNEVNEQERLAKIEEDKHIKEAQAKLEAQKAEDNKRKAVLEERGKKLCDIANRALQDTLTADDVAYIQNLYIHSKYPNAPHSVLDEMLNGKSIDAAIEIAIKTTEDFAPLLKMMGTSWDSVMKNTTREDKDKAMDEAVSKINKVSESKSKSDDIIITKFLQTL